VLGCKRQQCQLTGTLQGDVERALVRGTRTGLAPRFDLAAFRQEAAQPSQVLVVNLFDLVDAELADLAAGCEFARAAAEFARSTSARA
jgi:hypothetical protein